ncbi:MAG: amidohydrolase family protein [Planctomycetes bacterium]|nr:amidohydrolase family protein [Planctomycetota bacterium]
MPESRPGRRAGRARAAAERIARTTRLVPLCALLLLGAPRLVAQERPTAFVGAHVIPVSGPEIDDGTLLVQHGRIVAVGERGAVSVPSDAEVHDLHGKVVTPGLVDTHSHIGDPWGGDGSEPIQPEVRSYDGIDVRAASVARARAGGVTVANLMPGSGHLSSGQTTYIKLRRGDSIDDLALRFPDGRPMGGLKMANGTNSQRDPPFPGTRAKSAALVREAFVEAQEYARKVAAAGDDASKLPDRNLRDEVLGEVLRGERVVHHHTHRHDDIDTVLRLSKEFGFEVVLHHVSEGWISVDEIAAAGAPCSVILVDSPGGKIEAANMEWETAGVLERAGVLVALHTDDPITDSRLFARSAALAVRAGMSRAGALAALTLSGAKMLDLGDRVGSLEPGKDADLVVWSHDPLSVYAHVEQTWVDGAKVFDLSDPDDVLYALGGEGASHGDLQTDMCCLGGDK